MLPYPLHPAIVHMPLALAALLPFVVIGALIAIRFGVPGKLAWSLPVVMMVLLAGSAIVAVETGEDEEEVVEDVIDHDIIHEHEERAELFRNLSLLTLMIGFAGFVKGKVGAFGRGAGTGMVFLLAVLAWRTGESGGELVYEHGAANAYIEELAPAAAEERPHDDDDEEGPDDDR
jgi:hypothetical protein